MWCTWWSLLMAQLHYSSAAQLQIQHISQAPYAALAALLALNMGARAMAPAHAATPRLRPTPCYHTASHCARSRATSLGSQLPGLMPTMAHRPSSSASVASSNQISTHLRRLRTCDGSGEALAAQLSSPPDAVRPLRRTHLRLATRIQLTRAPSPGATASAHLVTPHTPMSFICSPSR